MEPDPSYMYARLKKPVIDPTFDHFEIHKGSTRSKSIPLQFASWDGEIYHTCGHGDKLGNSVCDFLQWYSKLSTAQIHSGLKHRVHMEVPCLRKLGFITVDDPS